MVKVKRYKFIAPFKPKKKGAIYRKTNLGAFKNKTGVYFIKEFSNWNAQSPEQRKKNRGQRVAEQ